MPKIKLEEFTATEENILNMAGYIPIAQKRMLVDMSCDLIIARDVKSGLYYEDSYMREAILCYR